MEHIDLMENSAGTVSLGNYINLALNICSHDFIMCLVSQGNNKPKGDNQKNSKTNLIYLKIFFTAQKVYRGFLMKPSPETLLRKIRFIQDESGLKNQGLFNMLESKMHSFSDDDKYCVLLVDRRNEHKSQYLLYYR